ncbi:hypothetical protein [Pseudomonas jessenii]
MDFWAPLVLHQPSIVRALMTKPPMWIAGLYSDRPCSMSSPTFDD